MVENINMKFNGTILESSIFDFIKEKVEDYKVDEYFDNDYDLKIQFNCNDITNDWLNDFDFPYWRYWHDTYDFLEKFELAIRFTISKIKECMEDCYFNINRIFVESSNQVENTEIQLTKTGLHNYETTKRKAVKIYFDIHLQNNRSIEKITDTIEYSEYEFYIDDRNNDKRLYNNLLLRKENGELLSINTLLEDDWKQLVLKEKITTKELAELYEAPESAITKLRNKSISSVKQYDDEYLFYYVMIHNMTVSDYYSNFCMPLLEQMKLKKINVVYEYLNPNYHEIFYTEEELKRQKEIERDNLTGKEYVMPLSGILLKKLYWAVKHHQLDRKILRNNWFNTYYGTIFLKNFMEQIEKNHILELYETGKIYEHPSFETYQNLYKKLNLKESGIVSKQVLMKTPISESKEHVKFKKARRICPPRDYVKLSKIKGKIGRIGEELVYDYEWNALKDYPELQEKIEKTYLIDDGAGYDIVSYDYDGNKIYIEVKTTKSKGNKRIKFHISRTEDEFISNHENAYIYYVYDLDNPKLRVIEQKTYLGYYKKVTNYEIDQEVCDLEES